MRPPSVLPGAFALRGGSTLSSGFAALLPVLILGLPIADTLMAIVRRTLHRLEHHTGGVFEADRITSTIACSRLASTTEGPSCSCMAPD